MVLLGLAGCFVEGISGKPATLSSPLAVGLALLLLGNYRAARDAAERAKRSAVLS